MILSNLTCKKILVVKAHPDDDVLGCGATLSKLSAQGCQIQILILGEGLTSRQDNRDPNLLSKELNDLHNEAKSAGKQIGVNSVTVLNFPDNRFDTVALLDIVKAIEKVKQEFQPDTVFTHHARDLNIDHQIVFNAVMISCRPLVGETVRTIVSCEVLSSTEWQVQNNFSAFMPNIFITVSNQDIQNKVNAMKCYKSESRNFPHPRSAEAIINLAKYRGQMIGQEYAEAFCLIRTC